MNKEVLFTHIIHSVELAKDFISSICNSFKDYLVKKIMERKNKGYATGPSCMKCLFISLNIFYLVSKKSQLQNLVPTLLYLYCKCDCKESKTFHGYNSIMFLIIVYSNVNTLCWRNRPICIFIFGSNIRD